MEYAPANTGDSDTTTILFRFIGYWVWARINQMSEGGARRYRYRLISYSSKYCCLDGRNWQLFFGVKILDLESNFRKFGLLTMLDSSLEYCMRVVKPLPSFQSLYLSCFAELDDEYIDNAYKKDII